MTIKKLLVLFGNFFLPAVLAIFLLLTLPDDGPNSVIWGLSRSRLMVALILTGIAISFFVGGLLGLSQPQSITKFLIFLVETPKRRQRLFLIGNVVTMVSWVLLGIPPKYFGNFSQLIDRVQPLLIWTLVSGFIFQLEMIFWILDAEQRKFWSGRELIRYLIPFTFLILIWGFIAKTGLGLNSYNTFWSKIGVPILWPQIILATSLGLISLVIFRKWNQSQKVEKNIDLYIVVIIWILSVVLWSNQSYIQGTFDTAPRHPNFEIYPINDSLIFDSAAQNLLIGNGFTGEVQDKPIYIVFVAIVHFFSGSNFHYYYFIQIMIFGLIPVCGYFLGKLIHSRPFGVMFAIILLIKEVNSIALTNYIQVSTSKMILSEMLTGLGIILFTTFFMRWTRSAHQSNKSLWLAGGILGITCLIRLNSFGILPMALIMIAVVKKGKYRETLISITLFLVFFLSSIAPWMVRNWVVSGDPLNFVKSKTTGVIINQRYQPIIETAPAQVAPSSDTSSIIGLTNKITTNFLHNYIGIALMVPPHVGLFKLTDLVRQPYWKLDWDGSLLPGGFFIILVILGILALGFSNIWKRLDLTGYAPLAFVTGYNLTTAIALTSGGRYLVPFDWGLLLYFSVGLFTVVLWLINLFKYKPFQGVDIIESPQANLGQHLNRTHLLLGLIIFLLAGSTPIISEFAIQKQFPDSVSLQEFPAMNQTGIDSQAEMILTKLANDPDITVLYGKALYPRYYGENKGEGLTIEQDPLIGSTNFDRLTFLLFDGNQQVPVVMPVEKNQAYLPSGTNLWVIGCKRENYDEAKMLVYQIGREPATIKYPLNIDGCN